MSEGSGLIKNKNTLVLVIFVLLTSVNLLAINIFGLADYSFEERRLSAFSIIFSASVYILYIVFCVFMRFRRTSLLAKGIFCYQLAGSALYILYFICFIFRIPLAQYFLRLFHAWSIIFEPVTVAIGRLTGIRAKYITAIAYLAITFITGKTVIAIRKDISYEKQYKEEHTNVTS